MGQIRLSRNTFSRPGTSAAGSEADHRANALPNLRGQAATLAGSAARAAEQEVKSTRSAGFSLRLDTGRITRGIPFASHEVRDVASPEIGDVASSGATPKSSPSQAATAPAMDPVPLPASPEATAPIPRQTAGIRFRTALSALFSPGKPSSHSDRTQQDSDRN